MTMLQQLTQSVEPCEYIWHWASTTTSPSDLVSYVQSDPRYYRAQFISPMADDDMFENIIRELQVVTVWNYYYVSMSWVPTLLSVNVGKHEYDLQQMKRMIK